ncbi:hypothetical protein [Paenibacillus sp. FSL R7-0652]|uniref:hypothetical protein n=1 Tax=Paenibacillus sp. FSL R7-0652 TaxID=2921687 RepID=UPI00315A0FFE
MKKAIAALIFLGVVAGCGSPSSDAPTTTTTNSETGKTASTAAAPETKQFQLKYKTSLTAAPLTKITPVVQSKQLTSQTVDDAHVLTYKKSDEVDKIYAALQLKEGTYDIGQIGYEEGNNDYSTATVDVLGESYLKVVGSIGANAPISNYVLMKSSPPKVLHIEAHTVDADVDQDGIKEIVATVGTAAETSIYKMEKDTLVSVNLNEVMNADVVTYDQESNTFKAEVTKGEMSQWKIEDTLLVPLP